MKTAPYGRILFGAAAVLLGAICLVWHDPGAWQTLAQIRRLPFGPAIGACLMALQIAGGIAIQRPRTARPASLVLAAVYALFCLACVPAILASPAVYAAYGSFFEQFSALSGATALYAAAESIPARAAAFARAARLGLGLCAVSFILSQVVYFSFTARMVPAWIPPGQTFWAILTTIAFALAALAILANLRARLALRFLTLMLTLFAILVWIPRLLAQPQVHLNWSEFGLTLLIAAAAWTVADLPSF